MIGLQNKCDVNRYKERTDDYFFCKKLKPDRDYIVNSNDDEEL